MDATVLVPEKEWERLSDLTTPATSSAKSSS